MVFWSIPVIERASETGGVIVAHWCVTKTTDDHSASEYGTKSFNPDPSSGEFIPFQDLTEEIVLGWCFTEEEKAEIETRLQNKIDLLSLGTVSLGIPW